MFLFTNVTYDADETRKTKDRLLQYCHAIMPALPSDRETAPPHNRYFVDQLAPSVTWKALTAKLAHRFGA